MPELIPTAELGASQPNGRPSIATALVDEPESAPQAAGSRALRTVGVAGLGMALPPYVVDNAEISAPLGIDDAWIVRRMGIHARRRAAPETTLVDLATEAGAAALADSGLTADAIDLVLVATLSHELATPNAAPIVAHALGAHRAGAFDVGCACTGWVAALASATAWIEAGRAETALVIGAELMSRHTNPADKRTAPLFGDAAGAAVISAGAPGTVGPVILGADGSCAEMITTDRQTGFILMDGHETFKQAVSRLAQASREACAAVGVGLAEIDLFIFHQANARITAALGERLELDPEKVVDCIGQLGNTSAASIPVALAHARADGRLGAGTRVLVAAVGAGFTWGAVVLDWELAGASHVQTGRAPWSRGRRGESAPRARSRWRPTAGRSSSTTAPTRPGRRPRWRRSRPAEVGRSPCVGTSRARRPSCWRAPRRLSARSSGWSTTPACGPTTWRSRSPTTTGMSCSRRT
jgi:3-oxoacyl-[acyl-carrier-protein] synthase III